MKITDTTKHSQTKTTWSLQDNKRMQAQRDAFTPTGKTPKNKTWKYLLSLVIVLLLMSYSLVQMYEEPLQTCIIRDFCINSTENPLLYTLFVFCNIAIIILAFAGAYILGKKLKSVLKV